MARLKYMINNLETYSIYYVTWENLKEIMNMI